MRKFFAGKDDDFLDVPLVVPDGFYGDCTRVLRGIPRGEVVTYGELASLAGFPGAARAAGTFCGRCALSPFVPDAPRRRLERHRLLRRPRRRLQAPPAGARGRFPLMALADDLRDELAQIAPLRRCCRLAEISALFHASGAWHLRGGSVAVHLDLGALGGGPPRVRAAARPGCALGDPHLPATGVRSGDALPAARRRRPAGARDAARGGGVLGVGRAARRAAEARRRPLLLPRRLPARRAPRRRLALRPARSASGSAGRTASRRPASSPTSRRAKRCACPSPSAATTRSPTPRVTRRSATCWSWPVRSTRRFGSRSTPSSRRRAASANRLANADEANLVRTARAAHVQLEAIRALDVDSLPAPLAEIAELRLRHPSASLRELAAQGAAADHEGGRAPAAARGRRAGRPNLICNCSSGAREAVPILQRRSASLPAVNTDPVRRHREARSIRRERSSSELSLRTAVRLI